MNLSIRPYCMNDADEWDNFCKDALQSTLLHTRHFLSYHDDRFSDCSLIIEYNGRCVGLLPAATSASNNSYVISHPGATYGGIVHQGSLRGELMVRAMAEIVRYFGSKGHVKFMYKVVPTLYHKAPAADDYYALFRVGAIRTRCDLSSTVDLNYRLPVSQRRRRSLNKALKAGVEISEGTHHLADFWSVLANNLKNKHGVEPAHDLGEIMLLAERFPDEIRCVCAKLNGEIIAGTVLFVTYTAHHAQYIASNDRGYEVSALDMVFDYSIDKAAEEGRRWFDFGISTEDWGNTLNDGLYRFKTEFGGGSFAYELYEIDLTLKEYDASQ